MKMSNFRSRGRRAISPIVATVLIVAVTLVASVAIAGFVFGIFSTQSNTAQVSVTATTLRAADFLAAGTTSTFTCGAAAGSFLTLANTGTAGASVSSGTITWAGATNAFSATGATCTSYIGGAGSAAATGNMLFPTTSKVSTTNAAIGGTYTGTVTLSSGAVLLFTGTFQ